MAEWILCLDELTIYNWRMKKTFFSFLSFVIQRMRLSKYNILFCCHLQPLKEKPYIASSLAVYQIIEKFDSSSFFLFSFSSIHEVYLETSSIATFVFSDAGHVFFSVKSLNSRNLVFFFLFLTFLQNRKFVYTTIHMFLFLVCYRCAVKIYRL